MAWVNFANSWIQTAMTLYLGTDGDGKAYAYFAQPEGRLDFRIETYDLATAAQNLNSEVTNQNEPAFVQLGAWWVNPENLSYLFDNGDGTTSLNFPGPDQVPYYRRQIASTADVIAAALNASLAAAGRRQTYIPFGNYIVNAARVQYLTQKDANNTDLTFGGPSSSLLTYRITVPVPMNQVVSNLSVAAAVRR